MSIWIRQASTIPVQDGKVCMVTSSNGKRWVLPKGLIDPGQTVGVAALNESWEEAGLLGILEGEPIGSYVYQKFGGECLVLVYRMTVNEVREEWPERGVRQRIWLRPEEAIDRIEEAGLREILRHTFRLKRTDTVAAT